MKTKANRMCLSGKFTNKKGEPFFCRSWRCEKCSDKIRKREYFRVMEGMGKRPRWAYMVLTLNVGKLSKKISPEFAYKFVNNNFKKLCKRIERRYGQFDYMRMVEQTPSNGFPHMNIIFHCFELFEKYPTDEHFKEWLIKELKQQAVECGFGYKIDCSYIEDNQRITNYIVKNKELPLNAPLNFRRIGASKGLLPSLIGEKSERQNHQTITFG